ncbi:MAG: hypothetical protein QXW62_04890 [Candidatus Methanomethylicaceae archaeon]|nr:hypothetical protein [Candidatus Verstraetearchaeota archaeon]
MDKISIFGLIITGIMIFSLVLIIYKEPFPTFNYSKNLVDINSDIGKSYSKFIWEERWQDLIAQAFVMFTAAASCLAMFRPKGGSKK